VISDRSSTISSLRARTRSPSTLASAELTDRDLTTPRPHILQRVGIAALLQAMPASRTGGILVNGWTLGLLSVAEG
jgi:hypothetical protein